MADKAAPSPYERLDAASERIRNAAKWLTIAFGSIASVAFAGFAISDIGEIDADDGARFWIAVVAAIVAVAALGIGLSSVASLTSAGVVGTSDLRKAHLDGLALDDVVPAADGWALDQPNLGGLLDSYATSRSDLTDALRKHAANPSTATADTVYAKKNLFVLLNRAVADAVNVVGSRRLIETFDNRKHMISGALSASLLAVVLFIWAANPPDEAQVELIGSQPTPGTLAAAEGADETLKDLLGEKCDVSAVPVQVLGTSDEGIDVITSQTDDCAGNVRLEIDGDLGFVTVSQ